MSLAAPLTVAIPSFEIPPPQRRIQATALLLGLFMTQAAWSQLRVVTYNTAGGARDGLVTVLDAIGQEDVNSIQRPIDVLLLQEQLRVSTTSRSIAELMNEHYQTDVYRAGVVDGLTLGAGRPGVVYRTDVIELIDELPIGSIGSLTQARQTMRYQLRPVGYDAAADLFVYNSHYKAGTSTRDQARRLAEAEAIRADADQLPDAALIYAGDFNIRSHEEGMYRHLSSEGHGKAIDPIGRGTTWHDRSASRSLHTQSPVRTARFPGQVTGGIDDRFDFQLVSEELMDGAGIDVFPNAYRVFGNNGSHGLNGEIVDGNGAAPDVLQALANASDHLPVVVDYQLPAQMLVTVSATRAIVAQDSVASFTVDVANIGPFGVDELDYDVNVTNALKDADLAERLGSGQQVRHPILLPTSELGRFQLSVEVAASDPMTANSYFRRELDFTVALAGDSNLDGAFDSEDLVGAFQIGRFEDSIVGNSEWAGGDWTGDGDFGSSDLVLAFTGGRYEQSVLAPVPEPNGQLLMASTVAFSSWWIRRIMFRSKFRNRASLG